MSGMLDSGAGSAILWQVKSSPNNIFSQEVHYKNENPDHKSPELSVVIKDVGCKRNQLEHKNVVYKQKGYENALTSECSCPCVPATRLTGRPQHR